MVAALLLCTALTPAPAAAAPVWGFVQGLVAAFAGASATGAAVAGAIGGATALGFGVGSFLTGSVVGRVLLSVGLSALAQALTRPAAGPAAGPARMANFAQPLAPAEWVFGRTRKGGPLGFTGFAHATDPVTGTAGARRHYSPILAAHRCKGIVAHWIDEREVELDADGVVITPPMAGYYRIRPFLGQPGQTADPALLAAFPEITPAHDFAGLTGAHIWAQRPPEAAFSTIYPRGRQGDYAPVLDGHDHIHDPRTGTRSWTRNAALILAFWITEILGQEVDWDEVATEADVADAPVVNAAGSLQPRWTLDGTIRDDQEFEESRAQLAAACDAFLYERADGKVGFRLGRWEEPAVTLTDADFLSLEVSFGEGGRQAPSEIAVRYTEPALGWREALAAAHVIDPAARLKRDEPALPHITSHNQALRVAKRMARLRRPAFTLQGSLGLAGYLLQGQRFVRIAHAGLGLEGVIEVGELAREESGLGFSLAGTAVAPEDFAFEAATEEPPRPVAARVASDDSIAPVTGLTGLAQPGAAILWRWDATDPSLGQQLRLRAAGSTGWEVVEGTAGAAQLVTRGLVDGTAYEAQVRNRTAARRVSAWAPEPPVPVTAIADSAPPGALAGFAATVAGPDVVLGWTAPGDPRYFATRIHRASYPAGHAGAPDFADAVLLGTEYGLPGKPETVTDAAPGPGLHAWWATPINPSGVAGPRAGPVTVTLP